MEKTVQMNRYLWICCKQGGAMRVGVFCLTGLSANVIGISMCDTFKYLAFPLNFINWGNTQENVMSCSRKKCDGKSCCSVFACLAWLQCRSVHPVLCSGLVMCIDKMKSMFHSALRTYQTPSVRSRILLPSNRQPFNRARKSSFSFLYLWTE